MISVPIIFWLVSLTTLLHAHVRNMNTAISRPSALEAQSACAVCSFHLSVSGHMQGMNETLILQASRLTADLQAARDHNNEMEVLTADLQLQQASLQTELEAQKANFSASQAAFSLERQQAQDDFAQLSEKYAGLESDLTELAQTNEATVEHLDQATSQMADLSAARAELQRKLADAEKSLDDAAAASAQAMARIAGLQTSTDAAVIRAETADALVSNLESQLGDVIEVQGQLTIDKQALEATLDALRHSKSAVEERSRDLDDQLEAACTSMNKLQREHHDLAEQLGASEERNQSAELELGSQRR